MSFDGTIGILQGISALLLTFDQSEVRKIVIVCQHVLNHLSYVEMIESMEQLLDFVQVNDTFFVLFADERDENRTVVERTNTDHQSFSFRI